MDLHQPQVECKVGPDIKSLVSGEPLAGIDAVINVLNVSRVNDFPWAPLRTPRTFLSDIMELLMKRMKAEGVNRMVVTSAWGANESKQDVPGWFRWFINHSNVGAAYRDHERQEDLLKLSHLDWTIVRPVGLINSKEAKPVTVLTGRAQPPKLIVSRLELAHSLVDIVERNQFIREVVTISRR